MKVALFMDELISKEVVREEAILLRVVRLTVDNLIKLRVTIVIVLVLK